MQLLAHPVQSAGEQLNFIVPNPGSNFINEAMKIESAWFYWKYGHKRINTLPETQCLLGNCVNFSWGEIKFGLTFYIGNKVYQLVLTETFTKKCSRNIFDVVRLIKNNSFITRQHLAIASFTQGKIRKEEMMVDDQQPG